MTKRPGTGRCEWCGRGLPERFGPGRPRRFCRQACRQAAYVAGQRRAELGLSEQELVVTRQALEDLRDRLFVLEAAVDDVDRDLEEGETDQALRDALTWLLAAARSLVQHRPNVTIMTACRNTPMRTVAALDRLHAGTLRPDRRSANRPPQR